MHAVKDLILKDCTFLEGDHPLGKRRIIDKEQRKEIGAWRVERKDGEKSRLPFNICEDSFESWLAVRAKALYNSYVFPPV